jgi:hypothetical protein
MPSQKRIKQSSQEEEESSQDEDEETEGEASEDEGDSPEEAQEEGEGSDEPDEEAPLLSRRERAEAARARSRPVGRTAWQRIKARFRDLRLPIYAAFFTVSLVVFILAILAYVRPNALGSWMESQFSQLGNYKSWFLIGGTLLILTASYYYLALIAKRREFNVLVATKSKGDFVRNQDRIERLAFELGSQELEVVAVRKREFRIRH